MKLVTALVALGLLASLIESCRQDQQGAVVDDCLARTHKTQAQCEEAP